MDQTYGRRFTLASLCVVLAACGGSDGDAVESFQLQFAALSANEDRLAVGADSSTCLETGVFMELKSGKGALPSDLVVSRVTLSRADGSAAWSPPLDPQRSWFYEDGFRWRGVAQGCSLNRLTGERFTAFPAGSYATITVHLSAGGLTGQLQKHDVEIGF